MPKQALSATDTMAIINIGRTKLYREMKAGRIVARKIGRKTVFLADEVERYLASLPVAA
jgi:predicted DNA-binding transcriptional regulator AlpA